MQVVHLDRDAVKQGVEDGSMLVIDVREAHEYEAGHIPGSVSTRSPPSTHGRSPR